ncbi:MAG: acetylxylan esterase [Candidatus Omnitrophota bacterium]
MLWRHCGIHFLFVSITLLAASLPLTAAEIKVSVIPDHDNWVYAVAEPIVFTVTAEAEGKPLSNGEIVWRIGPEQMAPFSQGTSSLQDGKLVLRSHGLDRPGFLRCIAEIAADGKTYRGLAAGAYEPERIQPTTPMPDDFETYWKGELEKQKEIPLDPIMEPIENEGSENVDLYHVSFACASRSSRFYGMLAVPKGDGPFPALLQVPGAGVRPYQPNKGWAAQGAIHLAVGIHGFPVNLPQRVYDNLRAGALDDYPSIRLDDRDRYYYRRVFLGCARAVDFLFQLEKFDGKTLGIHGGSQGGALSIITAGLDKRIRFIAAQFPAMCDHYGYLHERAGGWPHLFRGQNPFNCTPEKIKTAVYYDVVNFARILDQPILMDLGYNDETCPPTSMFSAYNVISSPKEMQIIPRQGHFYLPEQIEYYEAWLRNKLKETN